MGLRITYQCAACGFASGELSLGWGKGGRRRFWGGLALCPACKRLTGVNLARGSSEATDHRCTECRGLLVLLEGIANDVKCPRCETFLHPSILGSWT